MSQQTPAWFAQPSSRSRVQSLAAMLYGVLKNAHTFEAVSSIYNELMLLLNKDFIGTLNETLVTMNEQAPAVVSLLRTAGVEGVDEVTCWTRLFEWTQDFQQVVQLTNVEWQRRVSELTRAHDNMVAKVVDAANDKDAMRTEIATLQSENARLIRQLNERVSGRRYIRTIE